MDHIRDIKFYPYKILSLLILLGFLSCSEAISSQTTKVACLGNSVTFGYGLKNPGEDSYPAQLQDLLGDNYLVGNFGKSGATLLNKGHRPYMEQNEFKEAVGFNPDIIIVSLGLNDTDPRNWPNYRDDFIEDYMSLIQSFEKSDGTMPKVWIGRMTPIFHSHPRYKSGTRDWFWQIQKTIEQVAQNCNARIIDWHTPLHARPDLFPDALHPVKKGATIMAQLAYQHLTGNFGGLQPAPVFSDHMVLQRNAPITVWGKANSNEEIKLTLNNTRVKTTSGYNGKWEANFPPMQGGGPYQLKIESKSDTLIYSDVMIGEVWICSGQSNMVFKVNQAKGPEIANNEKVSTSIRLLNYNPIAETNNEAWDAVALDKTNNLKYLSGKWEPANKEAILDFSAIGWSFGEILKEELDVPVGLIQIAVGGAPTEAFIDRKTMEFHPRLLDMLYNWQNNNHTMQWCRQRAKENIANSNNELQRHPYQPAYLFEAGIDKIAGYGIKGVLWYQGESNAHNIELHETLFPAMVNSWRTAWNNSEMPILFAQLSSINRPSWAHFRDSQRRMAREIPNTWMVVTSDHGHPTDVHPRHKYPIGKRLAQTALNQIYNLKYISCGSIKIQAIESYDKEIKIAFSHTNQLLTSDAESVREMEVAGSDGLFRNVEVELEQNCIILPNPNEHIRAIRYGWHPFSNGNIVNENGVPVSTFKLEAPFNGAFKKSESRTF